MDITVTLKVKELVFDIQNKTFLTGRSREADDSKNFEAASNMQASDDSENAYQIRRSINNAYAELKCSLAEYISESVSATDNLIKEDIDNEDQLVITLSMPSNYNKASTDNLGSSLHQYIVSSAIADWFAITNKADAAAYTTNAQQALATARRALYKRQRPTRPDYGE